MWKYRGELIFGLGLLFAVKAVAHCDWPSVVMALALLGMHTADCFLSVNRVEVKLTKRVEELEKQLEVTSQFIGQLKAGANLTKSLTSGVPFGGR